MLEFRNFLLLWFSRKFLLSKRLASFTTLVLNCNEYLFGTLLFFLVWKDQFLYKLLLSIICSFSCSYSVFNDHFFLLAQCGWDPLVHIMHCFLDRIILTVILYSF